MFTTPEALALICFFISFNLSLGAWWYYRNLRPILRWPKTSGVITRSEVLSTTAENFDHNQKPAWAPHVEYNYAVNGAPIRGNKLSTHNYFKIVKTLETPPPASFQKMINRYKVDQKIQLSYNPENPTESVIEISLHQVKLFGLFALLFAALGFWGLLK